MKFLFAILAILLTTKECDQKKSDKESNKTELMNTEDAAKIQDQQEEYTIEYTASSRGFFKEIKINSSSISLKNSRTAELETKTCSKEVWDDILEKLKNVKIENISKLEAPTTKRFADAAPAASIKIVHNDSIYQSAEFDHGYPPKELELLCSKILELAE